MWEWLWGRSVPLREVVMYTRQGCHLCDDAWEVLESGRRRFRFTLQRVDVDADPALAARYGSEVPVVAVDGRVYFRGRVNTVLLDRLLRARTGEDRECRP